ncbi:GATA transcription factor [Stagonosporopsis vannaccii]|nr:GATA transcription factor [Stagonosporopsis vannaccii]
MSTPSAMAVGNGSVQQMSASPAALDDDSTGGIPRRPMRGKHILYTFDDQNKSNCLARLPNALSIPVVSLDEDTQVGVIELKTCIQAIVVASPELTAKLGHDYTVYAYDFSEYETPLVGQGMLSWILASASVTPNAPAEDSQTMVTGRVCKNILGLFSNGIKETLEVKLKLVPVPTSMQKEYVENMERYHSLSQIMPEGFDYTAWSDFLKENPTLGQLAQPTPNSPSYHLHRSSTGGYEPFHQMLTRHSPSQEPVRNDSFYKQSNASFMSQPSRASSPARSVASFRHVPYNPEPRPNSRASVRSEMSTHSQQCPAEPQYIIEFQEDGPPKKRARITQATRPRNTPLTARNDSLHKTAATASSVWLHRPIATNAAASFADAEMQPRAPTPRPGNRAFGARPPQRMPAPSALRHGSMDAGRPYVSPYNAGTFSDAAVDSGDDERDASPDETPRDIPSSPPVVGQPASPTPSSPTLPTFPQLTDSGFVSDVTFGREEDSYVAGATVPDGSDLVTRNSARDAARDATKRRKQLARMEVTPYDQSHKPWQEVNPGPTERLPQTYIPPPRSFTRDPYKQVAQSIETDTCNQKLVRADPSRDENPGLSRSQTSHEGSNAAAPAKRPRQPPTDSFPFPPLDQSQTAPGNAGSPDSIFSQCSPESEAGEKIYSREATPNGPPKRPKASKSRGLPRSHTWSGTGEPMSDAPTPSESGAIEKAVSRSGSHAKRKKYIKEKLKSALASGDMPDHCHNCGEIETPTWRRPYTRVEYGTPEGIVLSPAGIVAYEIIEADPEKGEDPMYRIYRNKITKEEKDANIYETMNLCNPCGLFLVKKGRSRPQSYWDKSGEAKASPKRRRIPSTRSKSQSQNEDIASDTAVPHSDAMVSDKQQAPNELQESRSDRVMPPPSTRPRASSTSTKDCATNHEELRVSASAEAEAALERAIQSSPAGFRRSKDSSVDVDPDLTPKPTRRLLFPSPRKSGEVKTLDFKQESADKPIPQIVLKGEAAPENPRCERCRRVKKLCDRQHPCGRCVASGHECIPAKMRTNVYTRNPGRDAPAPAPSNAPDAPGNFNEQAVGTVFNVAASPISTAQPDESVLSVVDEGEVDKENCPPAAPGKAHDDLSYLFDTAGPPKTTPKKTTPRKDDILSELLKTPTPGSRRRLPLTPRRSADEADPAMTPSRSIFTPRTMRPASAAPDTPFTRQLNAMLSDANNSSPSQVFDFSAFPVFDTPARASGAQFSDLFNDDFLSSDMPASSSPARAGMLGLGFDLYEDPNTSSVGLWTDQDMFSSDAVMLDVDNDTKGSSDTTDGTGATALLKMTVGGVTVDFASMIEEVVGNNDENADTVEAEEATSATVETPPCPEMSKTQSITKASEAQTSPEATSQGLAQTPDAPEEN